MSFWQLQKTVLHDLFAHKKRTFLAMLGIIIGVSAVIAIMAVGASAQDLILSQIKEMGTNTINILPGASEEGGMPTAALGIEVTTLQYEDAQAISEVSLIEAVCPTVSGRSTVTYFNQAKEYDLSGISEGCSKVEDTKVDSGRFITEEDVNSLAKVAVIGQTIKKDIFGNTDPLGKRIKINQVSFKIIGVMEERGVVGFQDKDEQVLIPVKTAQKIILGINHLNAIAIKVKNEENIDLALKKVEEVLRYKHHIKDSTKDDFTVRSAAQALDILNTITQAIKLFLGAVAGISLFVGGIGIMNVMFVIVNERIREIGLRKALGARRKDILIQFLMESATMTFIGGVIGVLFGAFMAFLVDVGVSNFGYDWHFIITPTSLFVSLFMAGGVGIVFGLWPANRASKLDPIESLRYE